MNEKSCLFDLLKYERGVRVELRMAQSHSSFTDMKITAGYFESMRRKKNNMKLLHRWGGIPD